MTSFKVTREIDASPAAIWAVLEDPDALGDGAFGILSITGKIQSEGRIKLISEVDPTRAFPLRVTQFDKARQMAWTGGMPFGLFKGERIFRLTPNGKSTAFSMEETFTGPLLKLIMKSMPDLQPSFEKFGDALKERAEA